MRYQEIIESINEKATPLNLNGVKMDSLQNFMDSLRYIPKDQLNALQAELDRLRAEKAKSIEGMTKLYHGAPHKIADIINTSGFELTPGKRSGFLGAINEVLNKGIFLTDSKQLANFFGSNRSEYGNDYKVFTCYADTSKFMDIDNTPKSVMTLGLKILKAWDGVTRRKIPMAEWWWLLDDDEFVNAIKSLGFTGVKFKEDKFVRKSAGDNDGFTYMVFDPKAIKLPRDYGITLAQFYEYLKSKLAT